MATRAQIANVLNFIEKYFINKKEDKIRKMNDLLSKLSDDKIKISSGNKKNNVIETPPKQQPTPPKQQPVKPINPQYSNSKFIAKNYQNYEDFNIDALERSTFFKTTNVKAPYRGLINNYQDCYMNSFLQSLFMTSELRNKLLKYNENLPNIVKQLKTLFSKLKPSTTSFNDPVDPLPFKRNLREPYNWSTEQQDVFLFGTGLFEQISEAFEIFLSDNPNLIQVFNI